MKWVLIIIVTTGLDQNVAITKVEGFTTVEQCRKAAVYLNENAHSQPKAYCIAVDVNPTPAKGDR